MRFVSVWMIRSASASNAAGAVSTASVTSAATAAASIASVARAMSCSASQVDSRRCRPSESRRSRSRMSLISRTSRSVFSHGDLRHPLRALGQRPEDAALQQAERAADRRQRRAQLVADDRRELVLDALDGAPLGDVVEDHDGAADATVLHDRRARVLDRKGRAVLAPVHVRRRSGGSRRPAATRASGTPRPDTGCRRAWSDAASRAGCGRSARRAGTRSCACRRGS